MAGNISQYTSDHYTRNIEVINIYGRKFYFSLDEIANGYAFYNESADSRPPLNSPIFIDIPENNPEIIPESARQEIPLVEHISSTNTLPITPDSFELSPITDITSELTDLEISPCTTNSNEFLPEITNNSNPSLFLGTCEIPQEDAESECSSNGYSESLKRFLKKETYKIISPIDFQYDDSEILLLSPGPCALSYDSGQSGYNTDEPDSPQRPSDSRQSSVEDTKHECYADDPDSPIRPTDSSQSPLEAAKHECYSDDPGSPICPPGSRKYSAEGAKPKNIAYDPNSSIRPSDSHEITRRTDGLKKRNERPTIPMRPSNLLVIPAKVRRTKSVSPRSRSPKPWPDVYTCSQEADYQYNHNELRDIDSINNDNQPSSSGYQSNNISHLSHESNINNNRPPKSFRTLNKVCPDKILTDKNKQEFRISFRLLDNYGRNQILSFMSLYFNNHEYIQSPSIRTNGMSVMRAAWNVILDKHLSIGAFLETNDNEDLRLAAIDLIFSIDVGSRCSRNGIKNTTRNTFGFLCIDPQYRDLFLGEILMEIRSETERTSNIVTSIDTTVNEDTFDDLYNEEPANEEIADEKITNEAIADEKTNDEIADEKTAKE